MDGWFLIAATGISDDGRTIVGWGVNQGYDEAWIARIPEPGSLICMLLTAGIAAQYERGLGPRRVRSRRAQAGMRAP